MLSRGRGKPIGDENRKFNRDGVHWWVVQKKDVHGPGRPGELEQTCLSRCACAAGAVGMSAPSQCFAEGIYIFSATTTKHGAFVGVAGLQEKLTTALRLTAGLRVKLFVARDNMSGHILCELNGRPIVVPNGDLERLEVYVVDTVDTLIAFVRNGRPTCTAEIQGPTVVPKPLISCTVCDQIGPWSTGSTGSGRPSRIWTSLWRLCSRWSRMTQGCATS
jgi:hypothetical protein